jgi:hypothetical protein
MSGMAMKFTSRSRPTSSSRQTTACTCKKLRISERAWLPASQWS